MIQKIRDPVKCNRSLTTSRSSLDHHNLITCVSDNCILLFLDRPDDVFELDFALASKLCAQDLIIDLDITLKLVDHFSIADLVLPFGSNLAFKNTGRCLIGRRTLVVIIKKSADRSTPVIHQWQAPRPLREISDPYIKKLRLVISVIPKIHSSKKRRIHHLLKSLAKKELFFIRIHLTKKCLLVIKIFITVLIHLCIVFPVIFVHILDLFLTLKDRSICLGKTFLQTFHYMQQVLSAIFYIAAHHKYLPFLPDFLLNIIFLLYSKRQPLTRAVSCQRLPFYGLKFWFYFWLYEQSSEEPLSNWLL